MKIYTVSDNNSILKAYTDKEKAKQYIINYIKSVYNQNEIYVDEYDDFSLYNFKHNNSYLTFKINKITLN